MKPDSKHPAPADDRPNGPRHPIPLRINVIPGGVLANFLHNFRRNLRSFRGPVAQPAPGKGLPEAGATRYTWEQIAPQLLRHGLTREQLAASGFLTDLLNGRRTGVLSLTRMDSGATLTGQLYLVNTPDRGLRVFVEPARAVRHLPEEWLGHCFSPEERRRLHRTGEAGSLLTLRDPATGQPFRAYVGLQAETGALTVLRRDELQIPDTIKGVRLTPEQRSQLESGRAVRLQGLTGRDGGRFDAYAQVSAARGTLTFARIPEPRLTTTIRPENPTQSVGDAESHRPTVPQRKGPQW